MKKMKRNSGQALLIILLVMAVGLTVALAVVSRSVTDIGISRQEEESARVFSVAEAGIEEALKTGALPGGVLTVPVGEITATVRQSDLGKQGGGFAFPGECEAGDIQTLWLVEHDSNGNLTESGRYTGSSIDVFWGNKGEPSDQNTTPALEVTLIYKDGINFKIKKGAFDPNVSRLNLNKFEQAESGPYSVGGKEFQFRKGGFELLGIPYALRLRLVYNNQPQILGAKGTNDLPLPSQGVCYESTATNPQTGITRKVQHCQFHKAPPGIFDYVLYSERDLTR